LEKLGAPKERRGKEQNLAVMLHHPEKDISDNGRCKGIVICKQNNLTKQEEKIRWGDSGVGNKA
jgi:hypothetical protein